ncbi:DUF484 family protein [Pseudomethylobacillus aquaticus]|uniref:DUF484 family protein n=1 Tax=Pseudomethylobacillus aquaticus TaxID=2676064 RepID=A0A3N0UZ15_9PROT|nr:DUF484 family protein [Pseudomethylobacillus aquaticus]ROH85806.1 DUF484 family protein [Pseudomethylobacillus aquaticus]
MQEHNATDSDINAEAEVSAYLQQNPQFFERHQALLADMYLPSQHGSGTVSLAERQQLAQRDKIRVLEARLAELMRFGEENDSISDKVHRLSLGLLASDNFAVLLQLMQVSLLEDFKIPYVGIQLWSDSTSVHSSHPALRPCPAELREWTSSQKAPYCGPLPPVALPGMFPADATPLSCALISLRGERVFGLLALAAPDAERFYSGMGTLYLKRIGELVSAALISHLP